MEKVKKFTLKKSKTLSYDEKKSKYSTEKPSFLKIFSSLKKSKKQRTTSKDGADENSISSSSQSETSESQKVIDKGKVFACKYSSLDRKQITANRKISYIKQLESNNSKDDLSVIRSSQKVEVGKILDMKRIHLKSNLKVNLKKSSEDQKPEVAKMNDEIKKLICETSSAEKSQKLQVEKSDQSTTTDESSSSYDRIVLENEILRESLDSMKKEVFEIESQRQKIEKIQNEVTKVLLDKEDELTNLRKEVTNLQISEKANEAEIIELKNKVSDFNMVKNQNTQKTEQVEMLKTELNQTNILLKTIESQVGKKQSEIDQLQMKNKEKSSKTQLVKKFGWFFCTYCKHSWTSDNVLCYMDSNRVFVLQTCNRCNRITHPCKVREKRPAFGRRHRPKNRNPSSRVIPESSVMSEEASTETVDTSPPQNSACFSEEISGIYEDSKSCLLTAQSLDDSVVLL